MPPLAEVGRQRSVRALISKSGPPMTTDSNHRHNKNAKGVLEYFTFLFLALQLLIIQYTILEESRRILSFSYEN